MVNDAVLVTGATGGLGRILASMLHSSGRRVVASGRNLEIGAKLSRAGMRFIPADLSHDDLLPLVDGAQTIFHLAARSAPWGKDETFKMANFDATVRLLKAARAVGCGRFIFASTPSIYARPLDQLGLTEASPLPSRMLNAYSITKYAAERAVLAAASSGLATTALRPRAIIGPYDTALLPRLLRAGRAGVLPLPGGGNAVIQPTDARDAARAFVAAEAALPAISGKAFNISGDIALPVVVLARHVFAKLGRKVRIIAVPRQMSLLAAIGAEMAARALPGRPEPALTRYSATVVGWSQTFDLSAARAAFGWTPRHAPVDAIDWALAEMSHA